MGLIWRLLGGKRGALALAIVLPFVAPIAAPQLLAFPYHATSHGSEVWSEAALPQDKLDTIMARSAALVAASPLADPAGEPRHIFLTNGGWRWSWLALNNRGVIGLTRALNEAVLVNGTDLAADRTTNGLRSLSGVIAHETCHGMERRRLGLIASDVRAPQWLREGYCDYVAQESTLSDADVKALEARKQHHPALPYYYGRKRVAAALAGNGGNVAALFATPDS